MTSHPHELQLPPFHPIDGLEVIELHGEFGVRQFESAARGALTREALETAWSDTEKDELASGCC